ncbi:MAG: Gp19/Gp15/Gp42 family protein [Mycetocola sp.]
MEPFAQESDLVAVWRPLTTDEQSSVDGLLIEASNKLRAEVPGIDTRVLTDALTAANAKSAVVNAVKRIFMNPEGYLTETIDGYVYRFDSAISRGEVYISSTDLRPFRRRRSGFRTIRLKAGM